MKRLATTTALALMAGTFAFGAQAQDAANSQVASACTDAWKQVDADGNGTVSAKEAKKHLDVAFNQIDVDGNDAISRQEYRDCFVRQMDKSAWLERREQDFDKADTDGNDEIAMNEFMQGAEQSYEDMKKSAADSSAEIDPGANYASLSYEEAADRDTIRDMKKEEFAGRSAYTFQSLDRDGNDSISRDEWTDTDTESGRNQARADAKFDEMDADSSDTLTHEEFAAQQPDIDRSTTAATSAGSGDQASETGAKDQTSADAGTGVPVFFYVYEIF